MDTLAREAFRRAFNAYKVVLAEQTVLREGKDPLSLEFQAALDRALAELPEKRRRGVNKRTPEGKYDYASVGDALGVEACALIREPFVQRAIPIRAAIEARVKQASDALVAVAAPLALHSDRVYPWRVWREAFSTTYGTTGSGEHYALGIARLDRDRAEAAGVISRVVKKRVAGYTTVFVTLIRVEEDLDVEILNRVSGLPFREQFRRCWVRGVNPRVYFPMTDPTYEAEVGIDCRGNDLLDPKAFTPLREDEPQEYVVTIDEDSATAVADFEALVNKRPQHAALVEALDL